MNTINYYFFVVSIAAGLAESFLVVSTAAVLTESFLVVSAAGVVFEALLQAAKATIATIANTFFIVLVFGLFYNRRKDNGIIEFCKY